MTRLVLTLWTLTQWSLQVGDGFFPECSVQPPRKDDPTIFGLLVFASFEVVPVQRRNL